METSSGRWASVENVYPKIGDQGIRSRRMEKKEKKVVTKPFIQVVLIVAHLGWRAERDP